QRMSTGVQSIEAEASLLKAARVMCAQHVHRLIVLDEGSTAVGVVTTLDVASALVAAVDEERQGLIQQAKASTR
ncbi:MAG: CBS domain-containing protein, partial [Planctomycetota bacterium]